MARRRGDWVPCVNYGGAIGISSNTIPSDILLVAPRDVLGSGEVGTVENEDDVLVMRVVGSVAVHFNQNSADLGMVRERIRVGLYDDSGAAAFYSDDFMDASEANEPFLWERSYVMDAGQDNNNVTSHPHYNLVDVRVKRRLRRNEALFYSIELVDAYGVEQEFLAQFIPLLRTWAR